MSNEVAVMNTADLARCEQVIERGKVAFVEVGLALMEIRDKRGYKLAGHETFEAYCRERWGWTSQNAEYHIGAATVARALTEKSQINLGFTHAAELARLAAPAENGDRRKKVIDVEAVKEVAATIDFTKATVKDVARAVDRRLGKNNNPITYPNQPAIDKVHGHVPLAGNSHVYTVNKLLWPEDVEALLSGLLLGRSLHMCCGKSQLGMVRLDLHEPGVDIQADAADTGLDDKSFDTVLCDPPYNGEFQWNHDLLEEMARLACKRIVFQHWFIPADPDGQYKKANYFKLTAIYVWQPRTYFGRAQLISVFDAQ